MLIQIDGQDYWLWIALLLTKYKFVFDEATGSVHLANTTMLLCTSTKRLNQFLTCSNCSYLFDMENNHQSILFYLLCIE